MRTYSVCPLIFGFREGYHFLSNFYPTRMGFDGLFFPSSEHAYQAMKCVNPEYRKRFTDEKMSAVVAKRRGSKVWDRPDLKISALSILKTTMMREILIEKFSQNTQLLRALQDTGEALLVEANTWHDTFWGVDAQTGRGENHLGRILMEVRKGLS